MNSVEELRETLLQLSSSEAVAIMAKEGIDEVIKDLNSQIQEMTKKELITNINSF